jgi:DNA polymerase-3 subunit epsilon
MLKNLRLERPLVILDLETTGKNVRSDRIVEICVLRQTPDGKSECKTRRMNPGIPIAHEATAVHGITDADVAEEYAFSRIARGLAALLEV